MSCCGELLYYLKCPNFPTKCRDDLSYHIAKNSAAGPKIPYTFKESSVQFPSFFYLRHHKQRYHTAETNTSGKKVEMQEMTKAWRNSYSRVGISWLIWNYKKGNDFNLIKSYFLTILINEKNIEFTVIKNAKQFVSFDFGDVQLPDIMNCLGGATSLDSFLKTYKTSESKGFLPYEWFDCPQKMNNCELPPYDAFFTKLRNVNPLDKDYSDYQKLLGCGLKSEEALSMMKLSKAPPSGKEN